MRRPIGVRKKSWKREEIVLKKTEKEFEEFFDDKMREYELQLRRGAVVPISEKAIPAMVVCFLRAGRYPRNDFILVKSGKQRLKFMKFNGYVTMLRWEEGSPSYKIYFSSGMEKWLRVVVLKEMWLVNNGTRKYGLRCHTLEQVRILQGAWMKWEQEQNNRKVFGSWMQLSKNVKLKERLQKKLTRFSPRRASLIAMEGRERHKK